MKYSEYKKSLIKFLKVYFSVQILPVEVDKGQVPGKDVLHDQAGFPVAVRTHLTHSFSGLNISLI